MIFKKYTSKNMLYNKLYISKLPPPDRGKARKKCRKYLFYYNIMMYLCAVRDTIKCLRKEVSDVFLAGRIIANL